jgi:hypothetical protein
MVGALVIGGCAPSPGPSGDAFSLEVEFTAPLPDAEVRRIGISASLVPLSEVPVSLDAALSVAEREAGGFAEAAAETTAHLLRVTDPARPADVAEPIVDRVLWIVRYAGIQNTRSDASTPPGAPPPSVRVLDHAYVYIDATTGAYLSTVLTE